MGIIASVMKCRSYRLTGQSVSQTVLPSRERVGLRLGASGAGGRVEKSRDAGTRPDQRCTSHTSSDDALFLNVEPFEFRLSLVIEMTGSLHASCIRTGPEYGTF
jgi:hypothetical protein